MLLWISCSTLFLSSCSVTERLFSIRDQMCEFDEYVVLSFDQRVEVVLRKPVLLESDIYLLMDALPTTWDNSAGEVVANYVFEQLPLDSDDDNVFTTKEIEFKFVFIPSDGELRLSRVTSSEFPLEILASTAILAASSTKMAKQACDVSINPFKRSVVVEVDQEIFNLVPDRRTAIARFGQPLESAEDNDNLIYEFKLKGDQPERPIVRIDASYDAMGDRLVSVNASFSRYNAIIDVSEGTVLLTLN